VKGGFAIALTTEAGTEATMPMLVAGNTAYRAALHEDGAVSKFFII